MHKLGIVLLVFVVVGSGAALVLSSRVLDIRAAWMRKAQKLEQELQENQEKLVAKRAALNQTRAEFARTMLGWDRYWPNVAGDTVSGTMNPDGTLNLDRLGGNRGLQDKQALHVFATNADGSSIYIGNFKITTLRDDRTALAPNWRVRTGDIPATARTFRVRMMVPPSFTSRFDDFEVKLTVADELVAGNQRELARQTAQVQVALEHLDLRLKEINGDPSLAGKPLPLESIEGLLAVMEKEEEARNAALAEDDRLLRALKQTNEAVAQILSINQRLTGSLPQPQASQPAAVKVGRR